MIPTYLKELFSYSFMQKIAIIIPAHNEEKRINKTLRAYSEYFEDLMNKDLLEYKIIVVINASRDKTLTIVKDMEQKNKRITYLDLERGGKGYAVIEGFKTAIQENNDLIGFVDADMATPPEAFHDLIIRLSGYDGIIASRWMKGSIIKTKQATLRRISSRTFNFLVKSILLLNFKDTQCGAKLFTSKAIKKVIPSLGMSQWAFDIELLYNLKINGFKIAETPTVWEDQKESKLNITKVSFQMFTSIIRLRLFNSPFKFIIDTYDNLPEKLKVHHKI